MPLERLFEYGGEQMMFYLGKDLGDLLVITLNKSVHVPLPDTLFRRVFLQCSGSDIGYNSIDQVRVRKSRHTTFCI